jgi:probable F420-dependent oxidoreductase
LAQPEAIARVALAAERLGYDSVWVQDHISRSPADAEYHFAVGAWEAWQRPIQPHVYDALATLAYVAGMTARIRLGTSAVVLPLRNPVVLAKEAASIDQLSAGRLILGVAAGGAYVKQELAAVGHPELGNHRGLVLEEWIGVMRGVWSVPVYATRGKFIQIEGAEVFPKPQQTPLPLWIGGTSTHARKRVGRLADGWLGIWLSPEEVRAGREEIAAHAAAAGRDPETITISSEHWLAIDREPRRAAARSLATRKGFSHHISLLPSAGDDNVATLTDREEEYSLVGTPQEILDRVSLYSKAGADLLIIRAIRETLDALLDDLELFREEVMAFIPGSHPAAGSAVNG